MKKSIILLIFLSMSFFGYSQDWFGFNRYQADNERITTSGDYPEVVFMGNSITEIWAIYHPTLLIRVLRHSPHVLSRAELTFGLLQDFLSSGS